MAAIEVTLDAFSGPLDLLLHLIEKNKIDIFDIPIVTVTDQYLEYVRGLESEDLTVTSEFMVMAAELIAIKCKMLLPAEVDEEGEEIDPRAELVERLLEYKLYRLMGGSLRDRMAEAEKAFYKPDTMPKEVLAYRPKADPAELLSGVTIEKLHAVFAEVLRRREDSIDPVRSRFGTIEKETVSLSDTIKDVAGSVRKKEKTTFKSLLMGQKSRMKVVVTFLAVLELMKYGIVEAVQEDASSEIVLTAIEGADLTKLEEEGEWTDM